MTDDEVTAVLHRRVCDDSDHQRQHADHDRLLTEFRNAHAREHEMLEAHRRDRAAIYLSDRAERERADDREKMIHQQAHAREHAMTEANINKASDSMEQRLTAMNEFRGTLADQATKFVSRELHDSLQERMVALNEATVNRIVALEKIDVKGEGKSVGQASTIALIVTSVGFAATLLGLIVVVSNILTATA